MRAIDLNCDMGEAFGAWTMGDDASMLDIVSSANIACGFHAGDPSVMHRTLTLAREKGVRPGAHPGFLDLYGFGRREIRGESMDDIEKQIIYQIGAMRGMAEVVGVPLQHVKPHGTLNTMANEDPVLAETIARALKACAPDLIFMVMPGMETEKAGERHGLRLAREIFADRAYAETGNLVSRRIAGSVIHDADLAADRVLRMLEAGALETLSGARIPVAIDTVCVHGDTPGAVQMASRLRARLEAAGIAVRPLAPL
ncbi:LamB/YcsF family protein [Pararhodobacter aggregans]